MLTLYRKPLLVLILVFAFITRLYHLRLPSSYVFDEVYHVPSLQAVSQNNPDAYDPYAKAPKPNTAYDWLHPPLAKLIQAGSVNLLGDHSFAWRFPSAVFGTLSVFTIYLLVFSLTKNPVPALIAAFLLSCDNLHLTMSRIAMNDVFVTTFILFSLTYFYRKQLLFAGIFTGLALATKHSAALLYLVFALFLKLKLFRPRTIFYLFITPLLIYLLSYSQFFLQGYNFQDLINLHKQIYQYQTTLSATHDYQSAAYTWPFLFRPVWFHVQYFPNAIVNIYNLGNPIIFWAGLICLGFLRQPFLLSAYLLLFLPWLFSPRIMFLHHYLPSLSLLTAIISLAIYQHQRLTILFLFLAAACFFFFYPLNTAIPISTNIIKLWFWLPTWK